jgi:hypothetical protein
VRFRKIIGSVVFALSFLHLSAVASELEARSKASELREPDYESQALPIFWGDAAFMRTCVPVNAPLPKPFSMYVIISNSGATVDQAAEPLTPVAQCIFKNTKSRRYPAPKEEYVFKINMEFNP